MACLRLLLVLIVLAVFWWIVLPAIGVVFMILIGVLIVLGIIDMLYR
jgi:hypothetical protein